MRILQPHTRREVFETSSFADNFIAQMQQSFAAELDENDQAEKALLRKYYDHLEPAYHEVVRIEAHAVFAFKSESRASYFRDLPLEVFFSKLETRKIFFIDFLDTGMMDFPFQNFIKRNVLKKMLGGSLEVKAFSLQPAVVMKVLELFYFSGQYERSAITIIAEGSVPVALRLCKDGNFHTNYLEADRKQVEQAAIGAGFLVGDIDLCWDYSVWNLPPARE